MRRFRFGALVTRALTAETWLGAARAVENAGYDTLLINDHVAYQPQLAPIPALVAAAGVTTDLRLGTLVL